MTTTGKKSRKQYFGKHGGPRALLKAKHSGQYVDRPAINGGRTRPQKIAASDKR